MRAPRAGDIKKSDMVQTGGQWGVVLNTMEARAGTPGEVQVSLKGGARKEWVPAASITAHEPRARAAGAVPAPAASTGSDDITRHVAAPVSVDIFENGAGQIDVGPVDNRTVYDVHRADGKWRAEHTEGPRRERFLFSADTVADLARKIANAHGVSGAVSIEDERGKGRSLTQRFDHQAPRDVPKAAQRRTTTVPATRQAATPTPIPVGAVDADRARLRPRIEGETDLAYSLRNAPSDFAAENILKGYSASGLRAVARDNKVTVEAGASKPQTINRLMEALRRRYLDSKAIEADTGSRKANMTHPDLVHPEAPKAAAASAVTPASADADLQAAYRKLAPGGDTWIGLADLRDRLPHLTREQQDQAIRRLARTPDWHIEEETNQKSLRERDRNAAISIGGRDQHTISYQPPPPPRGRSVAPAAAPAGPKPKPTETGRTALSGGFRGKTELVTYSDGTRSVHKKIWHSHNATPEEQADVEELAPHIMAAVGIVSPAVRRTGKETIDMDYVAGETGMAMANGQREQEVIKHLRSDDAKRIGLADVLTDNYDRNPGNWIIDGDGRMRPIDNGAGFETINMRNFGPPQEIGPAMTGWHERSKPWDNYGSSSGRGWSDNDLTAADIVEVRRRLIRLRGEFERRGRLIWYEFMFKRLDQIAEHAKGTRNLIAGGAS